MEAVAHLESQARRALAEGETKKNAAPRARRGGRRILCSAINRLLRFLGLGLPVVFMMLIVGSAAGLARSSGWEFQRGFNFMASAITGGAIVFPVEAPTRVGSKLIASAAGASGVGLFGFMVATLSNSAAAPLSDFLGITGPGRSAHGFFCRLGSLSMGVMAANLFLSLVLGALMSLVHGWDLGVGFKTLASVELGGGVSFHGMGRVTAVVPKLFYCVFGVWAISVNGLMIAVIGAPATSIIQEKTGLTLQEGATPCDALKKVATLVLCMLPCILLSCMCLVGLAMRLLTEWTFQGAFWAALPAASGGAAPLLDSDNPALGTWGIVVLICAASAGFLLTSLMIGVGAELVVPIIDSWSVLSERRSLCHAVVALMCIAYLAIPVLVFVLAVPAGGVLSVMEGWSFDDSFWWCVAVQLGGGMELSNAKVTSLAGMLLATVVVAWSIGILILSVGLSGATVVVPLMDFFGMTLDPEELRCLVAVPHRILHSRRAPGGHLPPEACDMPVSQPG